MNVTYLDVDHTQTPYDEITGENRDAFERRLLISWLYHDHALEGIALSRPDIDRALEEKPCRNYSDGEVQKSLCRLKEGIQYIKSEAREGRELTLDWIRNLHVRLCDEDEEAAGRYRQRDTSPGVYNLDIVKSNSISYHFHKLLEDFHEDYETLHPVRRAAMTHWEFMTVFPFDERTGVVGRLLMNFLLFKNDYPPALIHATDRHHYFQALRGHRDDLVPVVADGIKSTIGAASEFTDQEYVNGDRGATGTDSYRNLEDGDSRRRAR